MTAEHVESDGPLMPQPAMTRDALRDAVRRISLPELAAFDRECAEAFDRAVQAQSTNPLRFFLVKWATFVAVERHPARAAALHRAEAVCDDAETGEQEFRAAMDTITGVLADAQREIGL